MDDKVNSINLCIFDCHLIKGKKLYAGQNYCSNSKPTSQIYFEFVFKVTLDWKEICLMPQRVTINTFARLFQYKIINNVLNLKKMVFVFKKVTRPLCSFSWLLRNSKSLEATMFTLPTKIINSKRNTTDCHFRSF